jgi:hypothetical protein
VCSSDLVRKRGQEGKHEDEEQPGDHVEGRGRPAVLLNDLGLESRPQEGARRDQRHSVDRQSGHRQGALHFSPWRGGHHKPPVLAQREPYDRDWTGGCRA